MGGAKGIINVDLGQVRQLAGELRIIGGFTGMKADILQQHDLPIFEGLGKLLHFGTDAIRGHDDRLTE